jgi:hypothetical protein
MNKFQLCQTGSVTSCFFNKLLLWPASHQLASVQVSAVPNRAIVLKLALCGSSVIYELVTVCVYA